MVADVNISEERMKKFEKKVNMLMKAIEEMDYEIASIKNHIESRDADESSHTHIIKDNERGNTILQESQPQNSISIALLYV